MADLELHVGGDSHEAQDALHGVADAGGHAHDSMEELKEKLSELKESFAVGALAAEAFEKALETGKEMISESIEEYAKAEAAHRQLSAAAGEMTEAFEKQAEVIGQNLAIKAEDIEHMQTMLLRYGAAPEVIGNAVVAVQNFATATGQDANSAMMMLVRGVESGTGSLGRMGVKFDATGDQAHDFAAAVDALNKKFGGAAETDADSMTGRMRAASIQVDELKKAMGGFFATVESKMGVLATFTAYMQGLSSGPMGATAGAIYALGGGNMKPKEETPTVTGQSQFQQPQIDVSVGDIEDLGPTQKQIDAAAKREEAYLNEQNKWLDEQFKAARKAEDDELKAEEEQSKSLHKLWEDDENYELKVKSDAHKEWLKQLTELDNLEREEFKQQTEALDSEIKKREKSWEELGAKIGENLINGIVAAFSSASSSGAAGAKPGSGQLSADGSVEKALAQGIWSIFMAAGGPMGIIGNFIASGASGGSFGSGGGGIGGLTSLFGTPQKTTGNSWTNYGASSPDEWENPYGGVNAGGDYSAAPLISSHSGSWVRFHTGGWPGLYDDERPIIAQLGERILSRGEVGNMGGAGAVDAAARGGGGGGSMNIYAWDSQSLLDAMGGRIGRGMLNTVRTGKGPLREMFGGS